MDTPQLEGGENMKPLVLAGIVVTLIGAFIVVRGISYKSDEASLKVGEFKASIETRRTIPTWVGVAAIAGGLVLVVSGARRK